MEKVIYDNGKFCVFQYSYSNLCVPQDTTAYGVRRTDRPQDGMIFAHYDKDFCISIADKYKKALG